MRLLLLSAHPAYQAELLGMAQLAAAFGQEVTLVFEQASPSAAVIHACQAAGIATIGVMAPASGTTTLELLSAATLQQRLPTYDRVVRL